MKLEHMLQLYPSEFLPGDLLFDCCICMILQRLEDEEDKFDVLLFWNKKWEITDAAFNSDMKHDVIRHEV